MKKIAVVYWSQTGNTETMANAVADGAKEAGATVDMFTASEFSAGKVAEYDTLAFGCPAMGSEELEPDEFEPMFTAVTPSLKGKPIALFGSYDWGDGDWMTNWEGTCSDAGLTLAADSVRCNLEPDADGIASCKALGAALAK